MLASIATETKFIENLVADKMVATIAPLLGDSNSQIQLAATGALK